MNTTPAIEVPPSSLPSSSGVSRRRPEMGSLPTPLPHPPGSSGKIDAGELGLLFQAQRRHLEHFFDHLYLDQAADFAQILLDAPGAIFFSGVGKSGIVAHKIAQTLASLGFVRAAFLPPVDALHGDLLVLFSKSGTSEELLALVRCARAKNVLLLSITSAAEGAGYPLAALCDVNVHLPLQRELCPFGLAPVTSAAIQMVFGDTILAALMAARRLTTEQYAANHPAGKIGKSLIFKVKDVMKKKEELPLCKEGDMIMDQLTELTSKGCGCLLVVDERFHLIGTFTDGDLRRTLKSNGAAIFNLSVGEMCNRKPRTISPDAMAVEAMQKMESPSSSVQFLPVVDDQDIVIGIITLHGLVSAGL